MRLCGRPETSCERRRRSGAGNPSRRLLDVSGRGVRHETAVISLQTQHRTQHTSLSPAAILRPTSIQHEAINRNINAPSHRAITCHCYCSCTLLPPAGVCTVSVPSLALSARSSVVLSSARGMSDSDDDVPLAQKRTVVKIEGDGDDQTVVKTEHDSDDEPLSVKKEAADTVSAHNTTNIDRASSHYCTD